MKPKLLYIGNKLSKHGFNVTTIETLGKSFEDEGFSMVYTSDKKNQFIRLVSMFLSTLVNARKVDYIIIDTYSTSSFWYVFFCSQIARVFKTKYIPILHGGNLPNRLKNNTALSKMIFANSYSNVAPSKYLQSVFLEYGFDNTIYIPNVLEIANYKFKERNSFEPKILWVRAFASIYNPKMAIDVFNFIKSDYPNATLCMVGPDKDGSLETTKKYAEELELNVNFTGRLSKEKWLELSHNYDIFINTTNIDNTPISVMEAMAMGLPVISTNVGGIPYLLDDKVDSLLVTDCDSTAMANSIKYIIKNPEIASKIAYNARTKVESFDWNSVKKLWNNLLK
ncbi:MAG: glycosyltransferase family 4 protein [Flavobacterium sp.]|uniref:glycosyltransferase family 4 protein n=1 Tax=Flavobacterium sp. TaxID=239 RepID=UPI0022CB0B6B|nr:glycosyltransferase family 4 protein [Flavobacterium sp.]MCZ8197281.1 glycosyltransferase family 4 protein [Flavobacterium sp.]